MRSIRSEDFPAILFSTGSGQASLRIVFAFLIPRFREVRRSGTLLNKPLRELGSFALPLSDYEFGRGYFFTSLPLLATALLICRNSLRPEGVEPPTYGSEDHCSIQLSYGRAFFIVATVIRIDRFIDCPDG